jgi:nitric oxide dioxygenase
MDCVSGVVWFLRKLLNDPKKALMGRKPHSTLDPKTRGSGGMGLPAAMKPETVDTIAATAPVVAPKALDITKTFYGGMFKDYPSLLAYFNPAHNVPISFHQPQALAGSVVAYASNIRDLSPLLVPTGPVMAICHRHCALVIVPPQYVVVHDNLMKAVAKILGGAVTPEIAAAWSEAVLFLAKVCIDTEESLYRMAEQRSGGWSGMETFEVAEIKDVAEDIKSFSFKAPPSSPLFGERFEFTDGQYLTLKVDPEGDGLTAPRHYTVTSPPGADFLQCTVKKIPGGKVSTYLHEKLSVGDEVQLTAPYGIFTLESAKQPSVLMSAGIGVTPMVNFSKALGKNLKLAVHVDRTPESFAYRSLLAASGQPLLEKFTKAQGGGRPSPKALVQETIQKAGTDNNFYICGPPSWMEQISAELQKAGAKNVMTEVFGSQLAQSGCPFQAKAEAKASGCPVMEKA